MLYQKSDKIASYTVSFPYKKGNYAETYRVKNESGKTCFLKLIDLSKLNSSQFDDTGNILEIEILKQVKNDNICNYLDSGSILKNGKKYAYLVTEFVSSETLSEKITREGSISVYGAKTITMGILSALKELHNSNGTIIHNEVTIQNVLLDLVNGNNRARLIDFGHSRILSKKNQKLPLEELNLFYLSPEQLNGTYCVQSDLFSVGVLLYHMIFGSLPWFTDLSRLNTEEKIEKIANARQHPLSMEVDEIFELDNDTINIIKKALSLDIEDRFQTADDFLKALKGEIKVEDPALHKKETSKTGEQKSLPAKPAKGKGFSAIAGMEELKHLLQVEVIDALRSPEEYAKYGLTIPNGMLLYGPPGCGKTFFAKHLAEEVGSNFMHIVPSSLQSRYVNATQENIAKMFDEAEKNAPTIIFIEEMNELVPNRDNNDVHEMSKSAVNEMLSQMDRTGEKGIFIIGATNYPDTIDPAILRAGRLDKKYYLAPPDKTARKAIFKMYLENRPYDFGIDYDKLAEMTEYYVSADIELIVNNASRNAMLQKSKITMQIIEKAIAQTPPSVSKSILQKYEDIKAKMNGETPVTPTRRKIGFR